LNATQATYYVKKSLPTSLILAEESYCALIHSHPSKFLK